MMRYFSSVVSLVALLVSLLAFVETRRKNRIGATPVIIAHEEEGPSDYSYSIQNKGAGSAHFESVEYFLDGKLLLDTSLRDAIANVLAAAGLRFRLSVTLPARQNVMQPSDVITLVRVEVPVEDAPKLRAIPSNRFGIRIKFKSEYGRNYVWCSDDRLRRP